MKRKIILAIGVVLIGIQFIHTKPKAEKVNLEYDFIAIAQPNLEIEALLRNACYDCHSYETDYPWYSNFAPLSWWINHHVEEGAEHLNFSIWGTYSKKKANHKLEECVEETQENEMPLKSYTITHTDARLTTEERKVLADFFNALRVKE